MSKSGRPRTVNDDEILRELRASERPFVTASELAEKHNVANQTARRWLDDLVEKGVLKRHKVGGSAVVWWEAGTA